jgi:hypothetical protein
VAHDRVFGFGTNAKKIASGAETAIHWFAAERQYGNSDYWLLLAESHLSRCLFGSMLQRIWALPVLTG